MQRYVRILRVIYDKKDRKGCLEFTVALGTYNKLNQLPYSGRILHNKASSLNPKPLTYGN